MTPSNNGAGTAGSSMVSDLLARRAQIQTWLDRLEGLVDEVGERVAERVRADYDARLRAIHQELSEHVEALQADLAGLQARLQEAGAQHDAAVDALEEARLRYRIGELEEEQWETQQPELEGAVRESADARDTTREEVERLREILAQVEPHGDDGILPLPALDTGDDLEADAGDRADVEAAVEAEPTAEVLKEEPVAEEETMVEVEPVVEVEELAYADVFSEGVRVEEAGEAGEASEQNDSEAEEPESGEALPFLGASTEPQQVRSDSSESETIRLEDYAFLQELDRAIAATAPSDGAPEAEEARPQPGIKCSDCGYTNDPTAWYCGVCGVDLS